MNQVRHHTKKTFPERTGSGDSDRTLQQTSVERILHAVPELDSDMLQDSMTVKAPRTDKHPINLPATDINNPATILLNHSTSAGLSNEVKATVWFGEEVKRLQTLVDDLARSCNVSNALHDKQVGIHKSTEVTRFNMIIFQLFIGSAYFHGRSTNNAMLIVQYNKQCIENFIHHKCHIMFQFRRHFTFIRQMHRETFTSLLLTDIQLA